MIKRALAESGLGLDLRVVRDGHEALHYFQELEGEKTLACPDVVLLDLNLPKIDVIEVLRELRTGSRCRRTPVIVVTSSGSEQDRTAAEQLGAEAYFQKPADLTAYMSLGQLIRRVLDSSGERRGTE